MEDVRASKHSPTLQESEGMPLSFAYCGRVCPPFFRLISKDFEGVQKLKIGHSWFSLYARKWLVYAVFSDSLRVLES